MYRYNTFICLNSNISPRMKRLLFRSIFQNPVIYLLRFELFLSFGMGLNFSSGSLLSYKSSDNLKGHLRFQSFPNYELNKIFSKNFKINDITHNYTLPGLKNFQLFHNYVPIADLLIEKRQELPLIWLNLNLKRLYLYP